MTETSILRCSDQAYCQYGTNEIKLVNQLRKYAKEYPNEVQIIKENEDGYVYAHVPYNWFKGIRPPVKRHLSDEQREAAKERLIRARSKSKEDEDGSD